MKQYKYISVSQPIGTFYITSIKASELVSFTRVIPRNISNEGVQRELERSRVRDIAKYCFDTDATFPTAIIVSVDGTSEEDNHFRIEGDSIIIDEDYQIGSVIDGQHRLAGIIESGLEDLYELPVVFMYSLTLEEQAYIFSTINSKQKTVNSSLIYDLFGLTAVRSPQKLAHDMARILNQDSSSPFYKRLKMLGKKDPDQSNASISQGAFVDSVLDLILLPNEMTYKRNFRAHLSIVKDENKIFRRLYIDNKDEIILRIIKNCFNAVNEVFPELWTNTESILWKSTGFCGIMMALSEMTRVGWENGDLSIDYFKSVFSKFKQFLADESISLSNEHYGSGKAAQRRVSNDITSLLKKN